MKKYIVQSFVILTVLSFLSVGLTASAQSPGVGTGNTGSPGVGTGNKTPSPSPSPSSQTHTTLQNPINAKSVQEVILLAVDIAVWVGTAFAILAIIYVGFQFIVAQGNSEKISEAKTWFFYIIIGLAVLLSAKVIVEIVKNTLVDSGVVNKEYIKF